MEEIIKKDLQSLEILAAERSEKLVGYKLHAIGERVVCCREAIESITGSIKNRREMEMALMNFVGAELYELFDGDLMTKEYIEKGKSKQMVYLFVGTHWMLIPSQLYFVECKKMCRKMGLSDLLCEDPKFMCALFEKLAFMAIGVMEQSVPHGECWLNMSNGTLELKPDGAHVLRPHRKEDYFFYALNYAYSPDAECPMFMKFLNRVLPDKETQDVIAEYVGYCFTKFNLSKMLVLSGVGANGKSVLLEVITNLLGSQNVSNITLSSLTTDDEKRSHIENKLANISYESRGDLDTAVLKQVVSGEPTQVRKLYVGSYEIKNIPKLFTSYNRLPNPEFTLGYFRRWILVKFLVSIPETEQDIDLSKKLMTELSGILNWVLLGLDRLMRNKSFSKCDSCQRALNDYMMNANSVMQFVDQRCVVDDTSFVVLPTIYNEYAKYCNEEDVKKYTKKNFKEVILNFGVKTKIYHKQSVYGIRLKRDDE